MTDAGKLNAFHAGDPSLFRELVESHTPRLLSLARSLIGDEDEAHDAVQATWVQAFRNRRQLDALAALPGWLGAICRNMVRSEGRKATVRARRAPEVVDLGPTPSERPDARAHRDELRRAVSDAIAALPPRQREVVVLRILDGRSTRECARLLDIAEGTVKATLHHALGNLHPLLRSWNDAHLS